MARPKKLRKIQKNQECVDFSPAIPICLEQNLLAPEELESIRLHDALGLEQKEAAKQMNISQPTFHRIIASARRKIADALVNNKRIIISPAN